MAATLTILPRKKFEIKLEDNTVIVGQYGMWAINRFCKRRGVKLSQAMVLLKEFNETEDFDLVADYVLSAVEQVFMENGGKDFPYNQANAWQWIDQLGGWNSDNFSTLLAGDNITDEEKKSLAAASLLNSTISSESPHPQE